MARNPSGVHIVIGSHDYYDEFLNRCAQAGHPVGLIKSMLSGSELETAKKVSQQTTTIFRVSIDDDRDFPATANGSWHWDTYAACQASARDWMTKCDKLWNPHRAYVDYFELVNEPNMPLDQNGETEGALMVGWFDLWVRYCLDIADEMGYKLAVGSFSAGCPPTEHMLVLLDLMKTCAERGHILALHDGAVVPPFTFQSAYGNGTQPGSALRYRFWKQMADNAGYPFPRIAITECYDYGKQGWPIFWPDWKWYLTELAKDDYVLGAAWYTLGDGGMFGNIAGKPLENLTDVALSIDWDAIDTNPPPTPPYVPTTKLLHVPFTSQIGATTVNACGPASCAIAEAFLFGAGHTTQEWYDATGASGGLITIAQLQSAAVKFGYTLKRLDNQSLDLLKKSLDQNIAPILLVDPYPYLANCATKAPHFIVATGYELDGSAFYIHDPYTPWAGVGGAFNQQTRLGEAWGNCHLQGNPDYTMLILEKGTTPIPPTPFTSVLSGVGMGNLATLTNAEMDALRVSKVKAFKMLTLQNPPDNAILIDQVRSVNPDMFIVARLMFSVDSENKTKFSPSQFADYVRGPALVAYSKGVRHFETGNEPNLALEGWGWNWQNGAEFGNWFNEVCLILRRDMPNALFGFPGLSPQQYNQAWCEASNQFMNEAALAAGAADFLCCHSYYQDRGTGHWQMDSADFGGMYWKVIQNMFPNKPLYLTEYSCNNPNVPDTDKGAMYRDYLKELIGIAAAFSFCLSWNNDPNKESWVRNGALTDIPIELGTGVS